MSHKNYNWVCTYTVDYAVARCPSVRPSVRLSVRPSVTRRYSIETAKHIIKLFHRRLATQF